MKVKWLPSIPPVMVGPRHQRQLLVVEVLAHLSQLNVWVFIYSTSYCATFRNMTSSGLCAYRMLLVLFRHVCTDFKNFDSDFHKPLWKWAHLIYILSRKRSVYLKFLILLCVLGGKGANVFYSFVELVAIFRSAWDFIFQNSE
jgi:hypothetical protein